MHKLNKAFLNFRYALNASLLILLMGFVTEIVAQESCTQTLVDAQDVFYSGQIELVPEILEPCLQNGFNREEKVAAYRLLTLCHLYYNHTKEAAGAMQNMLKLKPEYKIQDIDPTEFKNLFETFRRTPIMIVGVKGGLGSFNLYETTNYNDLNSVAYAGTYSPELMLMGGVSVEVPIRPELSFVAEGYYATYSFTFSQYLLNYATVDMNEAVKGIEVPLLFQWNILKDKQVIPYVNVGGSMHFLLGASVGLNRKDTLTGGQSREIALPQDADMFASRNAFNFAFTGGVGVRIKDIVGKGYLTVDIRYSRYFENYVEAENRASNPSLSYSYMYTDNSFKQQNFQYLVGYKFPIYYPKQRKSARIE